jgi:hypothetical protein
MIQKDWAKDLLVDEPDGIPRYKAIQRDGSASGPDIYLKLSSAVMQQPTLFVAAFLNAVLDRDDVTGELFPKLRSRIWGAVGQVMDSTVYHGGTASPATLAYGSIGLDDTGTMSVGDKNGNAVQQAKMSDLTSAVSVIDGALEKIDTGGWRQWINNPFDLDIITAMGLQ